MTKNPTPLGYAIMGLLIERPRTGYAVRKVFEETAMGQYSSSPGSIYPALKRLEKMGLIEKASEKTRSSRPTTYFRVTSKGRSSFRTWLQKPIERRDITHNYQEVMLRIAFMDNIRPARAAELLASLANEIDRYLVELEEFLREAGGSMLPMARLALENGIENYRTQARWAAGAAGKIGRTSR